jgi:Phage-integrase repeat unit
MDIPSSPQVVYKKEWKGLPDWLGTDTKAARDRKYLPFKEAREYVPSLGLKSLEEWSRYCKSGNKPDSIPTHPERVYKKEWISGGDWLGYEDPDWSIRRVKELLRDWIKSGMIYEEDEIVLYHLLTTKGLLNLQGRNGQLFKNLIEISRTAEGRKTLEEYVNSDLKNPPGLLEEDGEEIGTASSEEIANLVEKENETDTLDYGKVKTVEQILKQSERLDSFAEDIENMQFYVNNRIKGLWVNAFEDPDPENNTVMKVRNKGRNGNKYHDTVIDTFLSDYEGAKSIKRPDGYSFTNENKKILEPTLMQKYVAYKDKTNLRFGNFSGTGAGKTLSAILSSRIIDSKMTIIICPNAVVDQWAIDIKKTFPDSI